MISNKTDREIWLLFKRGDEETVSFLYGRYFPVLYRYGLKFTPDTSLVEDTIQDLFAGLIKNHKTVGDTDNILLYLLVSFRRKLFREQEYANRYDFAEEMGNDYPFEIVWSVEQDIIRDEESQQQSALLLKALGELTARQKEAIYLRFTKELDYAAIAEIMQISIEACRNLISKAVAGLRKELCKKV